jgi:SAM-dependent methyltransferase
VSEADRLRWDARYAGPGLLMGEALKPLIHELEPVLPRTGRALDIACGEGQLALWLAERGLEVTAVDISPVGLEKLRSRAAELGLAARIHVVEADLDEGLPLPPGELDLVTCVDFYAPPVLRAARERLAPGGLMLVQVLLEVPAGREAHRAARGEALEFAAGLRPVFFREGIVHGRALAQLLAQREPAELLQFSDGGPACRLR